MVDTNKLKEVFRRDLDALATARDELRVQMHLAKAEARTELDRLDRAWLRLQDEVSRLEDHGKAQAAEVETAGRKLIEEVKRGYARLKNEIKM
jgi:hypothetical protein